MWEPTQGKHYAVLFSHILEVFTVECDEPVHSITFDTNQTSFTYVGRLQLVTCDDKGRMSVFSNIDKQSGVQMRLIKTDYIRLKSLQASPDYTFVSAVTNSSLAFWSTDELKSAFDQEAQDGLQRMEPTLNVPQSQRLLCSTVTIVKENVVQAPKVKKVKKEKKPEKVADKKPNEAGKKGKKGKKGKQVDNTGGKSEKSKAIKKRKKLSRDERKILQMQKKASGAKQ